MWDKIKFVLSEAGKFIFILLCAAFHLLYELARILMPFAIALGFVVIIAAGVIVPSVSLEFLLSNTYAQPLFASATLIIGIIAFWYRKRNRFMYGLFEVLAGVAITAFTVRYSTDNQSVTGREFLASDRALPALMGFVSSIYVVVRGLDNMDQARSAVAKPSDALAVDSQNEVPSTDPAK